MLNAKIQDKINELISKYPQKESVLLPALTLVQQSNNNMLSSDDIKDVAKFIGISPSKAYGVASYYSMYNINRKMGKYHLQVDINIPATLAGADEILNYLKTKLSINEGETTKDGLFTLDTVQDLGSCGTTPVILINGRYYENMTLKKCDDLINSLKNGIFPDKKDESYFQTETNVLLKNRDKKNSTNIEVYKKNGGYKALEKAYKISSEEIIKEVKNSMLRGRGGAGFPTGVKWSFIPKNTDKPIYLICNADEGEPGTFKDRQIMEYDPHLLIEGMAISALALGAKLGFIYIRGEFAWIADILEKAIEEASHLLKNFDIIVHRGAGSYVCGEETALIESIEGKRGQPRLKPPFPAEKGLYNCPTIVNNVETLASIPYIIENGAEKFKKFGTKNNYGFKLFGVSGHVNKPGIFEYPLGVLFENLIKAAGGVKGKLKAVIVGGLSVPILKVDELGTCKMFKDFKNADFLKDKPETCLQMDFDSCIKYGTALGSGGIIVINEETSIPKLALKTIEFYAHESCGKCTPCREGSHTIVLILKKLLSGKGKTEDIENILRIVKTVPPLTICPTGEAFSASIGAMVEKFRDEFDALIK